MERDLYKRLGCFGYHGFGNGWVLVREGPEHPPGCEDCPVRRDCWQVHRKRAKSLFPAACSEVDRLCEKHGGQEGVRRFVERHKFEPYIAMMAGNLEDGAAIAAGEPPKDRGPYTLTWPLEPLREQ